jgi:hypothetical protein
MGFFARRLWQTTVDSLKDRKALPGGCDGVCLIDSLAVEC